MRACCSATSVTGDQRYRTYVNTRLTGLARMAAHMRANYPTATFDTYPSSVSGSSYSLRRVLFPQNLDDSGSMCAAMIKAQSRGNRQPAPVDRQLRELGVDAAIPPE